MTPVNETPTWCPLAPGAAPTRASHLNGVPERMVSALCVPVARRRPKTARMTVATHSEVPAQADSAMRLRFRHADLRHRATLPPVKPGMLQETPASATQFATEAPSAYVPFRACSLGDYITVAAATARPGIRLRLASEGSRCRDRGRRQAVPTRPRLGGAASERRRWELRCVATRRRRHMGGQSGRQLR